MSQCRVASIEARLADGMAMTRRRADTRNPYAGIPSHELTEAQRIEAQTILVERYHGRKDRAAWDQRYWRGRAKWPTHTGQVFARSSRLKEGSAMRDGSIAETLAVKGSAIALTGRR